MKGLTFETTLVFNCAVTLIQEQTHLSFHDQVCTRKGCNTRDPIVSQLVTPPKPSQPKLLTALLYLLLPLLHYLILSVYTVH
jgi:hypothetical protein